MKPTILGIVIFLFSLSTLANSLPNKEMELSRAHAQLEILKLAEGQGNLRENQDGFFFLPLLVPATTATTEFVTMAFVTGFISIYLNQQLNRRLRGVSTYDKYDDAVSELDSIFRDTEEAILRTLSNADKLKGEGYSDKDLEELAEHVSKKEASCKRGENNNSPDNFCPDFKKSFFRESYKIEKTRGGFIVKKGGKFQCCLEWDSLHCGFEIFDKKGKHRGEVGCLPDEFNPCEHNLARGLHARPQADHRPRSQTCKK